MSEATLIAPTLVKFFEEGRKLACPAQVDQQVVFPLPTEDQQHDATQADSDLKLVCQVLKDGKPLAKAKLQDKGYFTLWEKGQLEEERGLVFQFEEPHRARTQQLRT